MARCSWSQYAFPEHEEENLRKIFEQKFPNNKFEKPWLTRRNTLWVYTDIKKDNFEKFCKEVVVPEVDELKRKYSFKYDINLSIEGLCDCGKKLNWGPNNFEHLFTQCIWCFNKEKRNKLNEKGIFSKYCKQCDKGFEYEDVYWGFSIYSRFYEENNCIIDYDSYSKDENEDRKRQSYCSRECAAIDFKKCLNDLNELAKGI